jgi:hypothetical protein
MCIISASFESKCVYYPSLIPPSPVWSSDDKSNKICLIFTVKKQMTKILKDRNLKISIDSSSKLESMPNLQPRIPVIIKKQVEPKGNDEKKLDLLGK